MERKKNSFFHLSERTDRLLRWGKITVTEDMFKTIGKTTATAPMDKKSHQNIVRVPYEGILILICGKKETDFKSGKDRKKRRAIHEEKQVFDDVSMCAGCCWVYTDKKACI